MERRQKKIRKQIQESIYSPCQITKSVLLPITAIGKNLRETLENCISNMVGGKCIVEGYVKPMSINVITYSSGLIKGDNVLFEVVFNCEVCHPVAGMRIECIAENVTKAGIRGESATERPSPVIVYINRDHFYSDDYFNSIEVGNKFIARVIDIRFELDDSVVSVVASLIPDRNREPSQKPTIIIDY